MTVESPVTTPEFPPLESFGQRIAILGPSNTGKSTLAVALAQKLRVAPVHLDQFRFEPNSDWQQRPDAEFFRLHDEAILSDGWVMDGNYSKVLPQRLARATGVILTADNRLASLYRYFRRTLFERDRVGALEGARDSIKWDMIHWITVRSPVNQVRYREALLATRLPFAEVRGMTGVNALYHAWHLRRP
jgi:adenylate kinase family enzyme